MKALITGASGFVGSTLVEMLSREGLEVFALMRSTSSDRNLKGLNYKKILGSLNDVNSLRGAVRDMDYIFHVAGVVKGRNKGDFFKANAEGTFNISQAVSDVNPGLRRFVYVSSMAAAGPSNSMEPLEETAPEQPVSFYGESKLEGEKAVLNFKGKYPVSIIRPPVVYGPKDQGVFVFVRTAAFGIMPILKSKASDGKKYYSTVHVSDLCRGIIKSAKAEQERVPSGEIFFICDNEISSFDEMIDCISEGLGRKTLRFPLPQVMLVAAASGMTFLSRVSGRAFPLNNDKVNELLPDFWICSNRKAKRMLEFEPEFDFKTGILRTVEWYKYHGWV